MLFCNLALVHLRKPFNFQIKIYPVFLPRLQRRKLKRKLADSIKGGQQLDHGFGFTPADSKIITRTKKTV
jgi:hypothetical protein